MRWILATMILVLCTSANAEGRPGNHAEFEAFIARPALAKTYDKFRKYLRSCGVESVVPPWTLWRQGTDWRSVKEPAFAAPPRALWPNIVPTLVALRDDLEKHEGDVEVLSGFRSARFNHKAGGSKGSQHLTFRAVDLRAVDDSKRKKVMHARLRKMWLAKKGRAQKLGAGFYDNERGRIHIDTGYRHRRWGAGAQF